MRSKSFLLFLLACFVAKSYGFFRPLRKAAPPAAAIHHFKQHSLLTNEEQICAAKNPPLVNFWPEKSAKKASLSVRGGGVVGSLLRTAIKNPLLILLMVASSLLVVYKEKVPYAKLWQSLTQACIVLYFFLLLVNWQSAQEEAQASE